MIRTINFALVLLTGVLCLGLYRVAERARVAEADLVETRAAIQQEKDAMAVLGAEWARVTRPARIAALASRHLDLSDKAAVALSSFSQIPPKNPPLAPESNFRNANAVVPVPGAAPRAAAPAPRPEPNLAAAVRTGT